MRLYLSSFDLGDRPERAFGGTNVHQLAVSAPRLEQLVRGSQASDDARRGHFGPGPNPSGTFRYTSQPSGPGLMERVVLILVARLAGELPAMRRITTYRPRCGGLLGNAANC